MATLRFQQLLNLNAFSAFLEGMGENESWQTNKSDLFLSWKKCLRFMKMLNWERNENLQFSYHEATLFAKTQSSFDLIYSLT